MKLNEKIFYCRKRAGLSQEALADRMGVSRQAVSKWETGEAEPELAKLRILADTFGVSADWLLCEDGPEGQTAGAAQSGSCQANAAQPDASAESAAGRSWVDAMPGAIGRLIRRYGWLFGVYLAVGGALFTGIGALARGISRSMVSGFGNALSSFDMIGEDYFYGFDNTVSSIAANNPVSIMGTFIMVFGLIMLVAGVVLAFALKRRAQD